MPHPRTTQRKAKRVAEAMLTFDRWMAARVERARQRAKHKGGPVWRGGIADVEGRPTTGWELLDRMAADEREWLRLAGRAIQQYRKARQSRLGGAGHGAAQQNDTLFTED